MSAVVIPEPLGSEAERQHVAYSRTPAGEWRARWGIAEHRDPAAAAAFVAETRIRREATYGRELYEEEVRALKFAADRATTTVSRAVAPPVSSWDIARAMRWGVDSPPPVDAAMGDVKWIARPG